MFRFTLFMLTLCFTATPAHGGKCTDIPLRFALHQTATLMNLDGTLMTDISGNPVQTASAIVGDGNDVYTNGTGVSAEIKSCGGTYDAVLNLSVSKRKISAILPAAIAGSGATFQTPPPRTYTVSGFLNVRNIICQGCLPGQAGQPFVTRAGSQWSSMYNGNTYNLRFLPAANISSLPFAPDLHSDPSDVSAANIQNATSLVIVLPQPYNCAQGVYPSWVVRGTLLNQTTQPSYLQVGTLLNGGKNGSGSTAVGQFSMPFEYQIQALTCFNPY